MIDIKYSDFVESYAKIDFDKKFSVKSQHLNCDLNITKSVVSLDNCFDKQSITYLLAKNFHRRNEFLHITITDNSSSFLKRSIKDHLLNCYDDTHWNIYFGNVSFIKERKYSDFVMSSYNCNSIVDFKNFKINKNFIKLNESEKYIYEFDNIFDKKSKLDSTYDVESFVKKLDFSKVFTDSSDYIYINLNKKDVKTRFRETYFSIPDCESRLDANILTSKNIFGLKLNLCMYFARNKLISNNYKSMFLENIVNDISLLKNIDFFKEIKNIFDLNKKKILKIINDDRLNNLILL